MARDLGISANVHSRCSRESTEHRNKAFVGQAVARDEELMRLRRELVQVKKERESLQSAAGFVEDEHIFAKETK